MNGGGEVSGLQEPFRIGKIKPDSEYLAIRTKTNNNIVLAFCMDDFLISAPYSLLSFIFYTT